MRAAASQWSATNGHNMQVELPAVIHFLDAWAVVAGAGVLIGLATFVLHNLGNLKHLTNLAKRCW